MGRHSTEDPGMRGQAPRPLYARALMLRHVHPGGVACFLFFEGVIAVAVVLALVGFVTWWGVVVLPLCVAAMVKLNDLVAGRLAKAEQARRNAAPPATATSQSKSTPPPATATGGVTTSEGAAAPPATVPPAPAGGPAKRSTARSVSGPIASKRSGAGPSQKAAAPVESATGAPGDVEGKPAGVGGRRQPRRREADDTASQPVVAPATAGSDEVPDQLDGFLSDIQDDGEPLSPGVPEAGTPSPAADAEGADVSTDEAADKRQAARRRRSDEKRG